MQQILLPRQKFNELRSRIAGRLTVAPVPEARAEEGFVFARVGFEAVLRIQRNAISLYGTCTRTAGKAS